MTRSLARGIGLFAVAGVALCAAPPAEATEALGGLDLSLRMVESPGGTSGGTLSGSDVELVLQALVPVHDVRLTFLASDGTPWKAATLPLDPGRLRWSRPGSSDPEEPGDVSLPAGGVLRTTFRMPFLKKGLYEIVVKAEGTGDAGPIATEGMLRIAVGMPFPAAQEREGVAEFTTEVGR